MSWSEYVIRHAGGDLNREIAAKVGMTEPNVSRWKNTSQVPAPDAVARFARAYGRPVLEAFVAAEFLLPEEARVRPAAAPDFTQLTNDELLELVRARMREEVMGNAEHPAPTKLDLPPVLDVVHSPVELTVADEEAVAARDAGRKSRGQQRRKASDLAEEPPVDDADDMEPR